MRDPPVLRRVNHLEQCAVVLFRYRSEYGREYRHWNAASDGSHLPTLLLVSVLPAFALIAIPSAVFLYSPLPGQLS